MRIDPRLRSLLGIEIPIIQAPMAGANGPEMAIAVSEAGGLGSLPCAMLTPEVLRTQLEIIRQRTDKPINLNFFVHEPPAPDAAREAAWAARLKPYYAEMNLDPASAPSSAASAPFSDVTCALVEEYRPRVVSFHFGMPEAALLARVRATGAAILSSATTVAEARWLAANGADAIIAQGYEAGGHRGMFLADDIAQQPGLFALLPQVVDAVSVPVIAAGGIADARGIVAAMALGASAVLIGTAYLFTPEATIGAPHRKRLAEARDDETALTNVFTGRPARGLINRLMRDHGPMNAQAPAFPRATLHIMPLRAAAEKTGSDDFTPLWSGQAAALGRVMGAGDLTRTLAAEAEELQRRFSSN